MRCFRRAERSVGSVLTPALWAGLTNFVDGLAAQGVKKTQIVNALDSLTADGRVTCAAPRMLINVAAKRYTIHCKPVPYQVHREWEGQGVANCRLCGHSGRWCRADTSARGGDNDAVVEVAEGGALAPGCRWPAAAPAVFQTNSSVAQKRAHWPPASPSRP